MHSQTVAMFGMKRLWIRTLAWLLCSGLLIGTSTVSLADELPAAPRTDTSTEGSSSERPQIQGEREGKRSGGAFASGLGAVFLLLGTGLTGGSIYAAAKGSAPSGSSDLASMAKNVGIPLGITFVAGGFVIIGAVAHRRAR